MSGMMCATLSDRSLIRVSGDDARAFLQNLVTCEVEALDDSEASYGALLTPQGKILFDFFVIFTQEGFLIDTASFAADDLVKRLKFYKLRAKVEIERIGDEMAVTAYWGGKPDAASGVLIADPRLADLGWRLYSDNPSAGEAGDYDAHRIALGIPEGGKDYDLGDAFPHEALMDQNSGIDFAKGCFVGQEVVSRMQHRGTARKRIVMVEGTGELPAAGTAITAGGKPAGAMGSSSGRTGLAMIRLDRAKAAMDTGNDITADGTDLVISLPPWAGFGWPQ